MTTTRQETSSHQRLEIHVATDFTSTPGPRSRNEGDFSGQEFLERLLLPTYDEARSRGAHLWIDLDGTEGYATSFLEAAFGGLARLRDPSEVLQLLELKYEDEPYGVEEIRQYIREARQ